MSSLCSLCSNISFLDLPPFPDWLGGHESVIADSELVPFVPNESSPPKEGDYHNEEEEVGLRHVFPACFYPQKDSSSSSSSVDNEDEDEVDEVGLRHVFPSCFYPQKESSASKDEGFHDALPHCFFPQTLSLPQILPTPQHPSKTRALGLSHHSSLTALQEAALSCEICGLIKQSVDRVRGILEEYYKNEENVAWDRNGPPTWKFWITKRRAGEDGICVWSPAEKSNRVFLVGAIGLCVDDGMSSVLVSSSQASYKKGVRFRRQTDSS
jgi:hypothetical protein